MAGGPGTKQEKIAFVQAWKLFVNPYIVENAKFLIGEYDCIFVLVYGMNQRTGRGNLDE